MAKAMTVAEFLSAAIDISGKTQREIGLEIGYTKPNLLSMMKNGTTKVPIDKIPGFARACGVDERQFLRLALNEYMPETWEVIKGSLNANMISAEEEQLLEAFRAAKDSIPPNAYDEGKLNLAVVLKAIEAAQE